MYEKLALIEALKTSTATLSMSDEEIESVADDLVISLHEQRFRLTSDDTVSIDG